MFRFSSSLNKEIIIHVELYVSDGIQGVLQTVHFIDLWIKEGGAFYMSFRLTNCQINMERANMYYIYFRVHLVLLFYLTPIKN